MQDKHSSKGPKVLIAGAGIGGLVVALALLKKGFDVQIFERDLTAIRGEGKYRGPIQVSPLSAGLHCRMLPNLLHLVSSLCKHPQCHTSTRLHLLQMPRASIESNLMLFS